MKQRKDGFVDLYVSNLEGIRKKRAIIILNYIRENYKNVIESNKYNMPTFELNHTYIAFASQKNYFSFYTHERRVIKSLKHKIPTLTVGKGCVKFKDTEEIPEKILKQCIDRIFTEEPICTRCKIKNCNECSIH